MDKSILSALFRDPVLNRLASGKTIQPRPEIPKSLVAKVTALKGEAAVLRWEGGNFTAVLNARVSPGETLLLEYNGMKDNRSHYRIMARFPGSNESNTGAIRGETPEPFLFGIMPGVANQEGHAPALVRFLPRGKQQPAEKTEPEPFLELFIDTENFGLVLVRFFYHSGGKKLECRFVVESREAGEALQQEAERLVDEAGGTSEDKGKPLQWSVGNLHLAASEALHQGGYTLNTRA